MTPEEWARAKEVLDAALSRPAREREAFVAEVCAGDAALRAEVDSLLAASDRAETFMATLDAASSAVQHTPQPGDRIGAYRVVREIGRGGMGIVYLAERADGEYRKQAAIKLIRDVSAPSVESRFRRERQILADLEHPNIARLLDAGTTGEGQPYFVMEHVLGLPIDAFCETLRLTVEKRLALFRIVCGAVAHAHGKGVLHRDIKPSNILVTAEGEPKLLDFGIAKFLGPRPAWDQTATGIAMTPEYASPEQIRGESLTTASDVYSLGVLLYRLLTAQAPYGGESIPLVDLVRAVCEEEPRAPSSVADPKTSGRLSGDLDAIVLRALRKEPERRYGSVVDLSEDVRRHLEGRPVRARRGGLRYRAGRFLRRNGGSVRAAAAVAVLAAILSGLVSRWTADHAAGEAGRDADAPVRVVPLTTDRGWQAQPSLSPDGRRVVFSWNGPDEKNADLYAKATAGGPLLRLTTDPAEDIAPAWSPDGGSIAFLRGAGKDHFSVLLIPAGGGSERIVGEVTLPERSWVRPAFLSWFPDGRSLAVTDKRAGGSASVFKLSVLTGERTQLTFPPAGILGDSSLAVSPDGRTLAFGRLGQVGEWSWSINVIPLEGRPWSAAAIRQLTSEHGDRELAFVLGGIAWTFDSRRLVYAAGNSLWTLDVASGGSAPSPRKLNVGERPSDLTMARETNRLVYAHPSDIDYDIWRTGVPKPGHRAGEPVRLIASTRHDFAQRYSPDGRKIAFESDRGGNLEIWVCDSEGNACRQLTRMGSGFTGTPAWSPDGRQIAFYSRVDGTARIFVIGAEGGAHRQLAAGGTSNMFPSWSRDGRFVYFGSNRSGRNEVWKVPTDGGTAVQVTRNGGFAATESLDGKWLYYTRSEALDASLVRKLLPDGDEAEILPSVASHNFEPVGDGIFFASGDGAEKALRFYAFADGKTRTLAPLPQGYVGLSVSPDRKWVLYTVTNPAMSNLSLVENIP